MHRSNKQIKTKDNLARTKSVRRPEMDLLRIFICFLVVLIHSPMPAKNANGPFLSLLSYLCMPAIGVFFMMSGSLILPVNDSFKNIGRRMLRIGIPLIVWTFIYLSINLYYSKSELNILSTVLSLPFSVQGNGVLWFIYTLLGLYLVAPIISPWLRDAPKKDLQLIIFLGLLSSLSPFIQLVASYNSSVTGILYYFSGYIVFFILGYYLRKYPARKYILAISLFFSLFGGVIIYLNKKSDLGLDFYRLFPMDSFFMIMVAASIWIGGLKSFMLLCNKCPFFKNALFRTISELSFGIYLIHILIMRYWLWKQPWIMDIQNYILQTIVIATVTMTLSILSCWLLSRIPLIRCIIGLKNKRN